ncbi:MAG: hypothetical protein H6P98_1500, partial [Candidatus Aminicenantes bacterium]|nr:hypothetical protein [Candidatus Aminicenantes bacterium]
MIGKKAAAITLTVFIVQLCGSAPITSRAF